MNKESGEYEYLLDRILGLGMHERITEDAVAKMLSEAVQTSYRRGGEECSEMSELSKQTVKIKFISWSFRNVRKKYLRKRR